MSEAIASVDIELLCFFYEFYSNVKRETSNKLGDFIKVSSEWVIVTCSKHGANDVTLVSLSLMLTHITQMLQP